MMYISFNPDQVRSIMAQEGKIEVCCEFCNEKYQFQEEEVLALIRK
jgi:redox-regulated HSP33 family molecular chaperone